MFSRLLTFLAIFGWSYGLAGTQDISWPMSVPVQGGTAFLYRPQLDSFAGNEVKGRAAISYGAAGATEPIFGTLSFSARVLTDKDSRLATLYGFEVANLEFPSGGNTAAAEIKNALSAEAVTWRPVLPIELLTTAASQSSQLQKEAQDLNPQAPAILFASEPTVLVTIDGEAKLVRVEGTPLLRVANTPFTILLEPISKVFYLKGSSSWFASATVTGPYAPAVSVPPAVAALAPAPLSTAAGQPPIVMVATQPTELIVTEGPAQFSAIPGTNLLYVTNTESDVFIEIVSQQMFLLLSGRWFSAPNQNGPWTYVLPDSLPVDFAKIPLDSPKADVLVSVPRTAENVAAVGEFQIPQTAGIKTEARLATVTYDGQPEFEVIEGTEVEYAVNTPFDILKAGGRYYCCHDAVWYGSDTAVGPFLATAAIPDPIYFIPPTNPLYRVTFVRAFSEDSNMIWFGYYPGYIGSYLWNGTIVYGTGWLYKPWFGKIYVPRQVTWGFAARYNTVTGSWGYHIAAAGARGWIDVGRPAWGGTSHGWWGTAGYHEAGESRGLAGTRTNVYGRDSSRLALHPHRDSIIGQAAEAKTPGNRAGVHVDRNTYLVTDTEGNVYKRDISGYHRYDGDAGWNHVDDLNTSRDLDRQFGAGHSAFERNASFRPRK